jgi:plastocyanin
MKVRWISIAVTAASLAASAPAAGDPPQPFSVSTEPNGLQHLRFSFGPLTAAPGQNLILAGPQSVATPPEDGYIVSFKPGLVRADGTPPPLEQVHMHHAVFLNLSRKDVTRPELPQRMFAFAEEKTYGRLPAPYGYPFKASDVLAINYMLHNETAQSEAVWITYELDFVPAGTQLAASMRPARPVWLDVENGKAYPVFDVHRGEGGVDGHFTYPDDRAGASKRNEWIVDRNGSLVVAAGHVHPGGLWTDLDLLRDTRRAHLFRSDARYFDPNGPVSWDMAMTMTPADWKVAVTKGDRLRVSATYDTNRASWYESMGIVMAFMVDDQKGAADPFSGHFATTGAPTHGQLKEATNYGGSAARGKTDPSVRPDGSTLDGRVGIANFAYLPGDQFSAMSTPDPPVVRAGQSLRFGNLDASASILHTVTACRAPCNGATGVSYPIADAPVDFDSGQLGYGPAGYTAASNRAEWQTPRDLSPGTYTYFCRVHPFMRGSFRVVGPARSASAGAGATGSRAPRVGLGRTAAVRGRIASVRVRCAAGGAACRGRLVARWRGRTAAIGRFAVPAGRARTVRVRLTRTALAALRRQGSLTVRLVAHGAGPAAVARVRLLRR